MATQHDDSGAGSARVRQAGAGAGAAAQPAETPWRHYPFIDKMLELEHPPVLSGIEKTCRSLDATARSGEARDRERAKAALTAYGRALDLYRELVRLRDRALAEQGVQGP